MKLKKNLMKLEKNSIKFKRELVVNDSILNDSILNDSILNMVSYNYECDCMYYDFIKIFKITSKLIISINCISLIHFFTL